MAPPDLPLAGRRHHAMTSSIAAQLAASRWTVGPSRPLSLATNRDPRDWRRAVFAKLEKFGATDRNRWHSSAAEATPCNDNYSVRRFVTASRPTRRPILCCHWHRGPSGALECVWEIEAPDAAAAGDEPGILFAGSTAAIIARRRRLCSAVPQSGGLNEGVRNGRTCQAS